MTEIEKFVILDQVSVEDWEFIDHYFEIVKEKLISSDSATQFQSHKAKASLE